MMEALLGNPDLFREIFIRYNRAFLPLIYLTYGLGLISIAAVWFRLSAARIVVSVVLALMWLWSGIVFFFVYFGSMTPLFYTGGLLFIVQAVFFFMAGPGGGLKHPLRFGRLKLNAYTLMGGFAFVYALVLYPLIGSISGYALSDGPWFGIAPCPLTIFTVGILLWTEGKVSRALLVIPLLWSAMGVIPVLRYGMMADIGEILIGVAGVLLLIGRNRKIMRSD